MRVPVTHTIRGRVFVITPMGAFRGLAVMERLARVLGPALGQVAASGKELLAKKSAGGKVSLEEGLAAAAAGLEGLCGRLEPGTLEWLARELAADTMVTNDQGGQVPLLGVFDLTFAADYELLFAWAQTAFDVSLGPLGGALGGLFARPGASDAAAK